MQSQDANPSMFKSFLWWQTDRLRQPGRAALAQFACAQANPLKPQSPLYSCAPEKANLDQMSYL
eukprot:scaffold208445_cov49-Prasinocladus_malaysianus.AAC.1